MYLIFIEQFFVYNEGFLYIEWMRKIALYENIKCAISIMEFVCKNQLQAVANNDH